LSVYVSWQVKSTRSRRDRRTSHADSAPRSDATRWWTRSQRIRTLAGVPLAVGLVETIPAPVYLQIAGRVRHLRGLGLTQEVIARELGVSARTVAKALCGSSSNRGDKFPLRLDQDML
jgi:hypothetical protein